MLLVFVKEWKVVLAGEMWDRLPKNYEIGNIKERDVQWQLA